MRKYIRKFSLFRNIKAFMLVEILVVIAVLALLIIFSVLYFPPQIAKARDAVRKYNVDMIRKTIEEVYHSTDCYPIALPVCGERIDLGNTTLMEKIPCDPTTKQSFVYVSEASACPKWFQLYGNLENDKDTIIDKLGCRNGCGPDCQFNYGAASTNQKLNPNCSVEVTPTPVTPTATITPTPIVPVNQYVCAPGGSCEIFVDPELSGCPDIYPNDPTCQAQCSDKRMRCHDARGKR